MKGKNVKMLAEEQLVNHSCLFFFLGKKKPLNVEVIGSPHAGRVLSTISPQGSGWGRQLVQQGPGPRGPQADLKGPSFRLFQEERFPTVALVPSHGPLQASVNSGAVAAVPKVRVYVGGRTLLSTYPECRCDCGFPYPWNV